MTTLIFVENVLGSGQVVKLIEDFGDYSVCRELRPGENARLVVSPFKSIMVEEIPLSRSETPRVPNAGIVVPLAAPQTLARRFG